MPNDSQASAHHFDHSRPELPPPNIHNHHHQSTLLSDAYRAANNLEQHMDSAGHQATMNAILDEVYSTALKGKSPEYIKAFGNIMNSKIENDGAKDSLVDQFANENFNFLSDGNKRIKTADLAAKSEEYRLMNRSLEQHLTDDLILNSDKIRASKHEGKFLGIGNKDGFDQRQLDQDMKNEQDKTELKKIGQSVANQYAWAKVTATPVDEFFNLPGSGKMTEAELEQKIQNNRFSSEPLTQSQIESLNYIDEHFKQMSVKIPNYNGDKERVVTLDSIGKYADKHGVNMDGSQVNQNAFSAFEALTLDTSLRLEPTIRPVDPYPVEPVEPVNNFGPVRPATHRWHHGKDEVRTPDHPLPCPVNMGGDRLP